MPFPSTPEELQRALSKKLRATRERATDPWRDEGEVFDVTLGVASLYKTDDTRPRRPWVLHPLPAGEPPAFVVVRVGGGPVVESSWVYRSETKAKVEAIAAALNALEDEAERGQEPEDASQ
jgi:hypothetical protein